MGFGEIIYAIFILLIIGIIGGGLLYLAYSEYSLIKEIHEETKAHNGTCILDGVWIKCSYIDDKITIINKNSECYRNDIKINCSELT